MKPSKTDFETALHLCDDPGVGMVEKVAAALAAVRRDGAEAMRERASAELSKYSEVLYRLGSDSDHPERKRRGWIESATATECAGLVRILELPDVE